MIVPPNYREGMSFDAAVAGYLADGMSHEDAEVYARVLISGGSPEFPLL